MLRDKQDFRQHISNSKTCKPYCDPSLFASRKTYADFLLRLHLAGMLKFRRASGSQGSLGVFFVKKKDGTLRIIFDTRKLNLRFKDPPKTQLPTASAFSQLECPADANLFIAGGDIRNACYGLSVPEDISNMFTLPFISASDLDSSIVDCLPYDSNTLLAPCLTVLPMGWNWALHLCQSFSSNSEDGV